MKKPIAKKTTANSSDASNARKSNVYDLLNKLDGNQLVELAGSAVNLLGNALGYLSEKEKTTQVLAECDASITVAIAKRDEVFSMEDTKRLAIKEAAEENKNKHELAMKCEINTHTTIMDLLDKVERGVISESQLEQLINSVKAKN